MPTSTTDVSSTEEKIKQIIGNIRNLPTPPIVFEQIQKVINDPDTSVGDIAGILSEDPAMSIKVLKLTNSAFYGLSREIDSVKHAVMIIGLEAVKNLVLSASVMNMFKADDKDRDFHDDFWRHSLATAVAARMLAGEFKSGAVFNPDPAFTSGLIHDIGKMIICGFMNEEHQKIGDLIKEKPDTPIREIETEVLGFDHALLGRQLILQWKLPDRMADTIGYHNRPVEENASDNYAMLINLADCISHMAFPSEQLGSERIKAPAEVIKFFGIEMPALVDMKSKLLAEYTKAETFMKIAGIS
jgi:putative nucleotidyltransferase with HDIG domain